MSGARRLRAALQTAHQRLEQTEFARSAIAGRVRVEEYVDYLSTTEIVVASLRTEVVRVGTSRERALFEPLADWVVRLQADLHDLASPARPTNANAIRPALRLARTIRRLVGSDDPRLLGIAYVLFGSHRGNRSLIRAFSVALSSSNGSGTRYVRATAEEPRSDRLREVLEQVDAVPPEALDAVIGAGREAFEAFQASFEALVPSTPRVHHVATLNAEAGEHPIPHDGVLLALATEVADRVMESYPYLTLRFRERGGRFARSDGAWLLTLGQLPENVAERQIDWLSGVLSNRGIPSVCLERHLRELHEELAALPPSPTRREDQTQTVACLRRLEQRVRARRLPFISDERFEALSQFEVPALGARAGEILVGAVVDQTANIGRCADNLRAWAADEACLDEHVRYRIKDALRSLAHTLTP